VLKTVSQNTGTHMTRDEVRYSNIKCHGIMTEIRWSSRAQAPVHIGSDWLSSHASQARITEPGSTELGPAHANARCLVACAHVAWLSMKLIGCLGV